MEDDRSKSVLRFVLVAVLAILFIQGMANARPARADGGGFPTSTPTRTTIPFFVTATATNTQSIFILSSPTSTQAIGVLGQQEQQPPPPNQAIPEVGANAAQASPLSLLSCWPFALVVILVLVVGVMWLNSRRQSTV